MDVANSVNEIDEDSNVVVVWIDVEKLEEAFRDSPDISVAHGEDAEPGEGDSDSLG